MNGARGVTQILIGDSRSLVLPGRRSRPVDEVRSVTTLPMNGPEGSSEAARVPGPLVLAILQPACPLPGRCPCEWPIRPQSSMRRNERFHERSGRRRLGRNLVVHGKDLCEYLQSLLNILRVPLRLPHCPVSITGQTAFSVCPESVLMTTKVHTAPLVGERAR